MSRKRFNFRAENLRNCWCVAGSAEAETIEAAFKAAGLVLPACAPLVMFRFEIENMRTRERASIIGQGADLAAAWSDAMKNTRETFNAKNDGKLREQHGLSILLPARLGDAFAVGTAVSRSVESFQSDETFAEEQTRKRLEAERKAEEAARWAA